jgi:NADH:ubiquinone oxidoreductase subunit 2 (subunit N)
VVALLGSAVSVVYYLRLVTLIYVDTGENAALLKEVSSVGNRSLLAGSLLLTTCFFVLTISPNFLLDVIAQAVQGIL